MASCKMVAKVYPQDDGSYALVLTVEGLSRDEAVNIAEMLHDPAARAVEIAVKGRMTDTTHTVSTRGSVN